MRDYKKQNERIKNSYDRFTATFPKGKKKEYQELAENQGKKLNTVINELLKTWYDDYATYSDKRKS